MRVVALGLTLASVLFFAGCGEDESGADETSAPEAALPAGLMLDDAPANAMGVAMLKTTEPTEDDVTVTGQIGGQASPFVENRAMFTMTDLELPVCDVDAGDNCETPWDSCCETPESIQTNMITVQVVDSDGRVVQRDLNGHAGLKPMARLTIRGTVRQQDGDVLILDARGIHVHADRGKLNVS